MSAPTSPPPDHAEPWSKPGAGFLRRLGRQPTAVVALVVLATIALASILAPWIAPYPPNETHFQDILRGPSWDYLLGTDQLGRDTLSRLLHAGRIALLAGFEAVSIALVLGVPIGLLVGYLGGRWDWVTMRLIDALMSLPGLVIALGIIAVLGPGITTAMLAVGLLFSVRIVRLVRGSVLSVREELFVDAARLSGANTRRVISAYVLPNVAGPIMVQAALFFGVALLIEAILSFLGAGVKLPHATWGTMLSQARGQEAQQPFLPIPPGVALTTTVLAFNLLADGIRGAIDPTPARRHTRQRDRAAPTDRVADHEEHSDALLSVRGLTVSAPVPAGRTEVLTNVSFDVWRGETVGMVGESGSGKSLTARAIMRLLPAGIAIDGGAVRLDGQELSNASERDLQRLRGPRMGLVLQDPISALNPSMTVGRQIAEGLEQHQGMSRRAGLRRAVELLDMVGVPAAEERLRDHPHQFSGGMAQRVVIAMALACEPDLLIVDEPTTGLDVTIQAQVLDLLLDLQEELDIGLLFITHDMGVVADICDRVLVMYAGEIVESASVTDLFSAPGHPYTRALLRSTPRGDQRSHRLATAAGQGVRGQERGTGCSFLPRCDVAVDACREHHPRLLGLGDARRCRCFLAGPTELEVDP